MPQNHSYPSHLHIRPHYHALYLLIDSRRAPHETHLLADMVGCTICVTSHWRSHQFSSQMQKWLI